MRRALLLVIVSALFSALAWPVLAQSGAQVIDVQVNYRFGQYITFSSRILTSVPLQQVYLLFRQEGEASARAFPMASAPNGQVSFTYDAAQNVLRPFTRIIFQFDITLQNGQTFLSDEYLFRYDDNRFEWKSTGEDGPIRVHWYSGDPAFGQAALDAAAAGLSVAGPAAPQPDSSPVEVYIYASAPDLQSALVLGGEDWQAGHASPDLGVVMAAIPPGPEQGLLMDQSIPHELAHVLLYRSVGNGYANIPVWLREGVATLAERFPNPDYTLTLTQASQDGTLLSLDSLCNTFPPDQASAFLAYAESASFTRYLRDRFGNSGLTSLAAAYADGIGCELGPETALGLTLSQLERDWRQEVLGENQAGVVLRRLLPYLLILGLLLGLPLLGVLGFLIRLRKADAPTQPR